MSFKDYYQVLGVSNDADIDEIKSAYRYLAKRYHPDKTSDADGVFFKDYMLLVNEAYTTLSNKNTKQQYDDQKNGLEALPATDVLEAAPRTKLRYKTAIKNENKSADNATTNGDTMPKRTKKTAFILFLIAVPLLIGVSVGTYWYAKMKFERVPQPITIADNGLSIKDTNLMQIAQELKNDLVLADDYEKRLNETLAAAQLPSPSATNADHTDQLAVNRQDERTLYAPKNKQSAALMPTIGATDSDKEPVRGTEKLYNGASPYTKKYGEGRFDQGSYNTLSIKNTQPLDAIILLVDATTDDVVRNEFVQAGSTYDIKKIPNGNYYIKVILGTDFNPNKTILGGSLQGGFEQNLKLKKFEGENATIRMQQTFENGKLDYTSAQVRI